MNPSRAVVDVHVLQSLPPSCINRDDTNSPKTAIYGGARRARVSSQSWKRATRRYFNEHLDETERGLRTRKLPDLLADRLRERLGRTQGDDDSRIIELVNTAIGAVLGLKGDKLKKLVESKELADLDYALFISESAIESTLERLAGVFETGEVKPDELKTIMGSGHSLDIALFGRMIADTPDLNVDAACQVSHAISTHRVSGEFDFFTTVDDLAGDDESGAAMMGYVEFNSSTLYRFATVSIGRLADNLGDTGPVAGGVRTFVEGFVRSLPTGHQNTFAAMTLPDLVFVSLRGDQPVSLVGAFESPVESTTGYLASSARLLAEHANHVDELYGTARVDSWASYMPASAEVGDLLGASLSFPNLLDALESAVAGQFVS